MTSTYASHCCCVAALPRRACFRHTDGHDMAFFRDGRSDWSSYRRRAQQLPEKDCTSSQGLIGASMTVGAFPVIWLIFHMARVQKEIERPS